MYFSSDSSSVVLNISSDEPPCSPERCAESLVLFNVRKFFLATLIFPICISSYWSWDIPIITYIPLNFLVGAVLEFSVSPFHYPATNIPTPQLFFILGLEFNE